jgi:hypothetical protein
MMLALEVFDEMCVIVVQGVRLNKLYQSWEDNPDIGFVMMKVVDFF